MKFFDAKKDNFKSFIFERRKLQLSFSVNIQHDLEIMRNKIIEEKDDALSFYTAKFDNVQINPAEFAINEKDKKNALDFLSADERKILEKTIKRVFDYHSKQKIKTWFSFDNGENTEEYEENFKEHVKSNGNTDKINEDRFPPGIITGQLIAPLQRVGIYVPGGKASYPSSVIMNTIPAKAAGVKELFMVTPPSDKLNNYVIAAAVLCGVDKIYRIGGPQAIFALAYGTETISAVDKIVGPGNIYVATAKKMVYGDVDIDMIAGPSEITVICDEFANPEKAAIDLMSQAEHDEMAVSTLITNSFDLIENVKKSLEKLIPKEDRKKIIEQSLNSNGSLVLTGSVNESIGIANDLAPEHLELYIKEPFEKLFLIKNAGAVFLGKNTPEAIGDYIAGPSHVLPTGGTARFFSPLDTISFLKRTSVIFSTEDFLNKNAKDIKFFSDIEGLGAHGNSVLMRTRRRND
jgi:histidinol dehydrogenase